MVDHFHDGDLFLDLSAHVLLLDLLFVKNLNGDCFIRLFVDCILNPDIEVTITNTT